MAAENYRRPCEVCGKRGFWGTVAIGNDVWWLCYDHQHEYRLMVLAWLAKQKAVAPPPDSERAYCEQREAQGLPPDGPDAGEAASMIGGDRDW